MPLDYQLWLSIEKVMDKTAPDKTETKEEFLLRLQQAATSLKKGCVQRAIARMKDNIKAIIEAKGYHPKND